MVLSILLRTFYMEKIIEIEIGIGFEDSELISYSYFHIENAITIDILLWNAKKVKITFMDPIFFIDRGSFMTTMFCQESNISPLHFEALNRAYTEIPNDHPCGDECDSLGEAGSGGLHDLRVAVHALLAMRIGSGAGGHQASGRAPVRQRPLGRELRFHEGDFP